MAGKAKQLTVTFYVGGKKVEGLTDEQREKIGERFGEALSAYYTAHPDEYEKL